MGRYLGKRLISTIPLLLVISFVVFMFIHMIPGDPARLVAGQDATKEDVAVVREQLGLDEPLLVQYGKYMKGLFTGDLGSSIKNGKTVAETIAPRLKPTIMLTFSSMIWAAIIGIAIGIIAAVFHGRILDYVGMIIAIAGISVPSFWLGLELIQLFSGISPAQKSSTNFVMGYALNLCKFHIYNVPYNHNIAEEGMKNDIFL